MRDLRDLRIWRDFKGCFGILEDLRGYWGITGDAKGFKEILRISMDYGFLGILRGFRDFEGF